MPYTALGVPTNLQNIGTSPLALRQIIDAMYESTGVVKGLDVQGTSTLAYKVGSGVAVTSRGDGDGKTLSPYEGGSTPTVGAGNATYPRIDAVWISAHNEVEAGDSDNYVTIGVTQGTPSANPVTPAIPSGATLLRAMTLPAGAQSTASATPLNAVLRAIPYGATLGKLGEYWWKTDMIGGSDIKRMYYEMPTSFTVPTDRIVRLMLTASLSAAYQPWESTARRTEWAFCFQLDGQDIDHSGANFIAYGAWETKQHAFYVKIPAGTHTVRVRAWLQNGVAPHFHYANDANANGGIGDLWVGRRLEVFDVGVDNGTSN